MSLEKIFTNKEKILPTVTAHGQGEKFVFLKNGDSNTDLTQFAYGKFQPGETCETHTHETMEEFFYFLAGKGEYKVNGEIIILQKGVFLRIPAKIPHELKVTGDESLEFIYFGISTH
ncbi:MAG: cupin domain-containing protein [Chitinophagaceae bacterium]